jgi:ADP-L-glycero-D-manno-heptose 6-epimerase
MVVVTGAAGFIGSCLVRYLLDQNQEVVAVDDFSSPLKARNLKAWKGVVKVERSELFEWLDTQPEISLFLHIGARTDTTEFDYSILERLNLNYTKRVWEYCTAHDIRLIYASSAATYGAGEHGYEDLDELAFDLLPLNPYGVSKNEFDKWALKQESSPSHWYGLKFFNVYGPNEYHKGRMASVVFHAFNQIRASGAMKLFRSHHKDFRDGEQLRDFIYVKDVIDVIGFLSKSNAENGLYNLGTGQARTFNDLVINVFQAMEMAPNVSYVDTPIDIRDKYQYFTEANMSKLRSAGYKKSFTSLEEGVRDYVSNYLMSDISF